MDNLNFIGLIFLLGIGSIGLLIGLLIILFGRNRVGERISTYVESSPSSRSSASSSQLARFSRFRYQLNTTLSALNSEEFQMRLNSANWQITVSEYYLIRFFSGVLAFLLSWFIIKNLLAAAAIAIIAFMIPSMLLFRAVQSRQRKFQDQLIDTLTLIRGAVRAGASFLQSLDVVIDEMTSPTSEEFRHVRREVELGLPLNQALTNLANRMESDDLYLVVSAVTINMQIGGNLTVILESVTETIRNRIYLFGEIRSLTSYARYSSYLLTLLPFLSGLLIMALSPEYFQGLFEPGITRYVLIYAIVSLVLGNIILRQVSKIKV